MQNIIDINADVGEGINNEAQLIPLVSSCNIACGGHAGDEETMQTVVKLAKQHHVKIGAHPSYPDKENFGRVIVDMPFNNLVESLKNQIEILLKVVKAEDAALHHIKPHGALYNYAAINTETATAVVEVMKQLSIKVKLYAPYKSVLADLAIKNNIEVVFEAFADRNYNPDLTLVSRNQQNAVIKDEKLVFNHVYKMFTQQKVLTIKNTETPIKAQTFCVHGDNPKAIQLIKYLTTQLKSKGISIS